MAYTLRNIFTVIIFTFISISLQGQGEKALLQSGPMPGYTQQHEVAIWLQTSKECKVRISYWDEDLPEQKYNTSTLETTKQEAFTAQFVATEVQPGREYRYEVYINNEKVNIIHRLEFQTLPSTTQIDSSFTFKMALGSCFFTKEDDSAEDLRIINAIEQKAPDVMLWLGDNVYLRNGEWNSEAGLHKRYTATRSHPILQPLLGKMHHYAIWDDHDYGPNNHNRSFIYKDKSMKAFENFWANPTYGFPGQQGVTTQFSWGDVDFFLLDNRWFRSANNSVTGDGAYFGNEQIRWLIESLKASKAAFKIIANGGQIVNPAKVYENYANYEEERKYLFELLDKEKIEGVLFLSGDRHHTELSKMPRNEAYPLYDLTVSPLTAKTYVDIDEKNEFRVEKTLINQNNFATLTFRGPITDRIVEINVYDKFGKLFWVYKIEAKALTYR